MTDMDQKSSISVQPGYTDYTMPPVVHLVPPVDPLDRPIVVAGPRMRQRFPGGWLDNMRVHELLSRIDVSQPLCSVCKGINLTTIISARDGLGQDLFESFAELDKSAKKGCPLCGILYNSIQIRGPYAASQKSLVVLRAYGRGEGDVPEGYKIRYLEALFYCRDPFQGKDQISRNFIETAMVQGEDRVLKVQGKPLAVYVDSGKQA
jgi:hypothetical protein